MKTSHVDFLHNWNKTTVDRFWNNIAYQEPVFHVYESEEKFLEILAGFVGTGINADECTVVIATRDHLDSLRKKLEKHGLYVNRLIEDDRYLPLAADEVLSKFMKDGLPDEQLFFTHISNILDIAKKRNRSIRAFREMTSVLWGMGNIKARNHLEVLWDRYSQNEILSIFCAYPKDKVEECDHLKEIGIYNRKVVTNASSNLQILYKQCTEN